MLMFSLLLGIAGAVPEKCRIAGVPEPARCHAIDVPIHHDDPGRGTLRLRVAVLPALGVPKAPDPVFFLAGGPGQAAMSMADSVLAVLGEVRKRRDVVLLDQRGTTPGILPCPGLASLVLPDAEETLEQLLECRKSWSLDLTTLNTATLARDTEYVRRALGYSQINLWGGSYGTRLGQELMRRFPSTVRVAVFDGVASTQESIAPIAERYANEAFQRLQHDCEAEPACAKRFPQLAQQLPRLMDRLKMKPIEGAWPDPLSGENRSVVVSDQVLISVLRGALYSSESRAVVPLALEALDAGDPQLLLALNAALASATDSMATGHTVSVMCADDAARMDPQAIARERVSNPFGASYAREWITFCGAWKSPEASLLEDIIAAPILMISGALDPVTPPRSAEAAGKSMRHQQHLVVDGGAHINSHLGCIPRLIARFIEQGDGSLLDTTCAAAIRAAPFMASGLIPLPIPSHRIGAAP
ncbi:MAG: alpha/beta fold hydrolase [Rhodanobacteraceae bacterium]|nr:alpha/beta fold hydrolase [Rhodanobacteraceae bacterium]